MSSSSSPNLPHSTVPTIPGASPDDDDDAFLRFIEYARSALWCEKNEDRDSDGEDGGEREMTPSSCPPWSWIVSRVLKTCMQYPSGVTAAILLSDLSQSWSEQNRHASSKKKVKYMISSTKRQRRRKLPNTVTIDSIHEKNFLNASSILEVVILETFVLPGTNIHMLTLGDIWSTFTIDLYLHRRFYDLASPANGILRKGREILLTGCCLRTPEGCGHARLLPTEYLVILLDEDQDEDAMLLGAQFCSDSFSSISLESFREGYTYAFYARIEDIGSLEIQGTSGTTQRKQITLVENDGTKIKFLLWGEQVLLANCFIVGSMLAVTGPFIASAAESNIETCERFCLEYGSATHLYLVPFVQQEEPVLLNSTQIRYQGSTLLSTSNQTQSLKISQVSMPFDYEGSVDLKDYPFRSYVADLHDKMTGVSLYCVVTRIYHEANNAKIVYSMMVEDITGAIVIKLHFMKSWSLGRISRGHSIYITGLMCSITNRKLLEASWFDKDPGSSLVNLSCLPALPNSSCLHTLSYLSDLSTKINATHICSVRLDQIEHHHVNSSYVHAVCGHVVDDKLGVLACGFCSSCDGEVVCSFDLNVILVDDSANVSAWCSGPTATEMLQICPDEFYTLPEAVISLNISDPKAWLKQLCPEMKTVEVNCVQRKTVTKNLEFWKHVYDFFELQDEQAMYLCTLEKEKFIVVLVNRKPTDGDMSSVGHELGSSWEIVRAQKYQ